MVKRARQIFEFGPFRLIPQERQLLRGDEAVPLTPKAFDLLLVLVENSGHLVTKDELMKRVWGESFVEEANLSVNISSLRRALGEAANENQYVETVPRCGYRFVAAVSEIREEASVTQEWKASGVTGAAHESAAPERTRLRLWPLVLAALVVISLLLAVPEASRLRQPPSAATKPVQIRSLAVLPLENSAADPAQEYFADGVTEALINELAQIGGLRVSSRSSVMRYKRTGKSTQEIARALNVEALLTGSVIRSGERVRIAVQLINASNDQTLWGESYDRDLRDILTIQNDLTRAVAGRIQLELRLRSGNDQVATVGRVDPEAYDRYLRGQFHLHRQSREDNDAAIEAFENAVSIQPDFAAAWAELAQAYVWKFFLFAPHEGEWERKAFVAAEKALALDRDAAPAYLARGRILWTPANNFPHEKAIREYRRALSLNPGLDEARNQLALIYSHIGLFDAALEESRRAILADPNNNLAHLRAAQTLNFDGKFDEALTVLRKIPNDANPTLVGFQIAWALFNLGRREEAISVVERRLRESPEDSGGLFTSMQAIVAASRGDQQVAVEKIKAAVETGTGFGHFHHTAYNIACAYALLNRRDEALKWLEVTAGDGFPCYPLFERDRNLDNLRGDARFTEFLATQRGQWELYKRM